MRLFILLFVVSIVVCCRGSPVVGPDYVVYRGAWCGLNQPPTPVCNLGGAPVFVNYLKSRKIVPSKLCGTPPNIVSPSTYSTESFNTDQLNFFNKFYPTFTLGSIFARWQDWEYRKLSKKKIKKWCNAGKGLFFNTHRLLITKPVHLANIPGSYPQLVFQLFAGSNNTKKYPLCGQATTPLILYDMVTHQKIATFDPKLFTTWTTVYVNLLPNNKGLFQFRFDEAASKTFKLGQKVWAVSGMYIRNACPPTLSSTPSISLPQSASMTKASSASSSPTHSISESLTSSVTTSLTHSVSVSEAPTHSSSISETPTHSSSISETPTHSSSISETPTHSLSATGTPTSTPSASHSSSTSLSSSASTTPSFSITPSASQSMQPIITENFENGMPPGYIATSYTTTTPNTTFTIQPYSPFGGNWSYWEADSASTNGVPAILWIPVPPGAGRASFDLGIRVYSPLGVNKCAFPWGFVAVTSNNVQLNPAPSSFTIPPTDPAMGPPLTEEQCGAYINTNYPQFSVIAGQPLQSTHYFIDSLGTDPTYLMIVALRGEGNVGHLFIGVDNINFFY